MITPWGAAQDIENIADGIQFVSTASHGGMVLSSERAAQIPASIIPFTADRRYWEEDCDAAIVVAMFGEDMNCNRVQIDRALDMVRVYRSIDEATAIMEAKVRIQAVKDIAAA